jgi:hypothetical protein
VSLGGNFGLDLGIRKLYIRIAHRIHFNRSNGRYWGGFTPKLLPLALSNMKRNILTLRNVQGKLLRVLSSVKHYLPP